MAHRREEKDKKAADEILLAEARKYLLAREQIGDELATIRSVLESNNYINMKLKAAEMQLVQTKQFVQSLRLYIEETGQVERYDKWVDSKHARSKEAEKAPLAPDAIAQVREDRKKALEAELEQKTKGADEP